MGLIYLLLLIHSVCASDYCNMCVNRTHTLCQYKEGPSASCFNYHKIDLTDQLKNYIVDIHNDIRNHVASGHEFKGRLGSQPPASNMNQLYWDDELATMAQRWADQCISINSTVQHDVCKNTERFEVGQNILTAITADVELPELAILILNWYKQVSDVIPSDIKYFAGIKRGQFLIGQYTQLVWAETKYVGCGMSTFRDPENMYYYQRLVCNYGPGGNVVGDPVYIRGRPCSKCPSKRCDSFRNNLCQNSAMNETKFVSTIILSEESFDLYQPDQQSCFLTSEDFTQWDLNTCFDSLGNPVEHVQKPSYEIYFSTISPLVDRRTVHISTQETRKSLSKMHMNDNNVEVINMMNNIKNIGHDAEVQKKKVKSNRNIFNNQNQDKQYHENHQQQHNGNQITYPFKLSDGEVKFSNNVNFKRADGKWYEGHCRCDRIYRSSFCIQKLSQTLFIFTCIFNIF